MFNITLQKCSSTVMVICFILHFFGYYYVNKKSYEAKDKDTANEIKKMSQEFSLKLQEKDKDTANEIKKMQTMLENRKQEISWEQSNIYSSEYIKNVIGIKRYTNVCTLKELINLVAEVINSNNYTYENLKEFQNMLDKVVLPSRSNELYPIEIALLLNYRIVLTKLKQKIEKLSVKDSLKNIKS